jgi:hypothetical protein
MLRVMDINEAVLEFSNWTTAKQMEVRQLQLLPSWSHTLTPWVLDLSWRLHERRPEAA